MDPGSSYAFAVAAALVAVALAVLAVGVLVHAAPKKPRKELSND